jgi:aminoglycoside phosphotransferase (APT) family kinase protein
MEIIHATALKNRKLVERFGGDLAGLVRQLHSPLSEVTLLTTLPSPVSGRASLRLRLEDGRTLKAIVFETESEAKRAAMLLRFADRHHFPEMLGRRGRAMMFKWVDGRPVVPADCGLERLGELGRIHAKLHSTPLPGKIKHHAMPAENWNERLDRYFHEFARFEVLAAGEQRLAARLALNHSPKDIPVGLVHKDFCAENMVIDPSGHIWVIDIETFSVDSPDYDLARTWHRWPMKSEQSEAYLDGYRCLRSTVEFQEYSLYWKIAVLVESALFRLQRQTSGWEVPIRRLLQLIHETSSPQTDSSCE